MAVVTPLAGQILPGPDPDLRAAQRPVSRSRPDREVCVISYGASRRTGAITGIRDDRQCMQPEQAAGRLMRMKNELRIAAGLVLAVALAACGTTSPQPQPRPVMAHGVALREPLVSARPTRR
jgi:hypothetical protein